MNNQTQLCGRPTRTGAPCRRPLQWYETACNAHQSPAETEQAYWVLRAAETAQRAGR
jgi:hypothetical protein